MFFEDLNLYKEDRKYVLAIVILSILCFIKLTEFANAGGILHPDSALYLINSLKYAGMDYYNIVKPKEIYFSPVISFLTSILFRLGLFDKIAIVIVSMSLAFAGYVGMYILFKTRFNPVLSFLGVALFGCSSIVIYNLPQGLIDLPFVSLSVWALVFAIAAIDKNPKYFLISIPLIVLAIFTKYTAGYMIPIIFLYYVMKRNFVGNVDCLISNPSEGKRILMDYLKSREVKYILLSIGICVVLGIIICKTLIIDVGGSLSFLGATANTFNGHQYNINSPIYTPDKFHYLFEFPVSFYQYRRGGLKFVYGLCAIFLAGFVICIINIIRNREAFTESKKHFRTRFFKVLLWIVLVLSLFASAFAFLKLSNHLISNVALLVAITVFYGLLQKYEIPEDKVSLDLLMVAYFLVYFIFLSLYTLKDRRYALPFVPPFIYMVLWGFNSIMKLINNRFGNSVSIKENIFEADNKKKYTRLATALPVILIILLLVSTTVFLVPQEFEKSNKYFIAIHHKGYVSDLMDVCDFIKENDTNYQKKSFATLDHAERQTRWYLQHNVFKLKDNSTMISEYNRTTYVILNGTQKMDNYHEYYNAGDYVLYRHN